MSPAAPYVPTHRAPQATEADQARMAAKLAKRSNPSVQISPAAQSPKEKSGSIEWHEPEKVSHGSAIMRSRCGRFRIDKIQSQLSVGYTCWLLNGADLSLNKRLGCADSKAAAIELCETCQ